MKTLFYFLVLILSLRSYAQSLVETPVEEEKMNLRHIMGFQALDFTTGLNQYGRQFSFGYSRLENEKLMERILISSETGKINLTGYTTNYLILELNHTVYKIKDVLFFNLGYGVLTGDETTSNEVINNKTNTFSYGLLLDVNSEIYLLRRFVLLIEFKEIWDNGSSFGPFRYYGNAGLRFYL